MTRRSPASSPQPAAEQQVEGSIERLVYSNPENGWTVSRLRLDATGATATAVGRLPGIQPGERLRLRGAWVRDPKYGRQFRVESFVSLEPNTLQGIHRFLGSGLIPGIGREMARRLVERFGLDTLEVIEKEPERIAEVDGIGPARLSQLHQALLKQKELKDVLVFLHTHEIPSGLAGRILDKYGLETISVLRDNPYRLASEVHGIGFERADRVAASLGMAPDSPRRLVAGAIYLLGKAAEDGHLYLPRPQLIERTAELLRVDSDLVERSLDRAVNDKAIVQESGTEGERLCFRPDLHAFEVGAALRLLQLLTAPRRPPRTAAAKSIASFEHSGNIRLARQQREAIAKALEEPLLVVTGGPGTGKTTLVKAIVQILAREGQRIELAAPTGRAANRLAQASGVEARTLHRLLEFDPARSRFLRTRKRPLDADLVIVDESSMIDCPLAYALLQAIPDTGRLLLVGDADQLPSVGPGSVLGDLLSSGRIPVVRLGEVFRQAAKSAIIRNAHRLLKGQIPTSGEDPGSDFFVIERESPESILSTLTHLVMERVPGSFRLDSRRDVQILTPMRRGLLGTDNLNLEFQALLNPEGEPVGPSQRLRLGDRVMQIRNNYELEVFNGEVGRIERKSSGLEGALEVAFESRRVTYGPGNLEELALAYACSVHKAQGSEYPCVILPIHSQHYIMLRRNLLYTAITRARRLVILVGERRALARAVRTHQPRGRFTRLRALIVAGSAGPAS